MENVNSFIKSEKEKNDKLLSISKEKRDSYNYEIIEIEKMIEELSKNIDTTFEIFSPNSLDKDNNVVEIEKLKFKKNEIAEELMILEDNIEEYENKKIDIEKAIEDISDLEVQVSNNIKNTKYLISKEVSKVSDSCKSDAIKFMEYQAHKDGNNTDQIDKKFSLISNKIKLCENFIDIDLNRAKLELFYLKEELDRIGKIKNSKMFHVKHFISSNGLKESISNLINEYKTITDIKFEYSYSGENVKDTEEYLITVLRIVKECFDNSIKHSNCNIINIAIVVDKIENIDYSENNNIKENTYYEQKDYKQMENKQMGGIQIDEAGNSFVVEMKQINFIVKDNSVYNITIKITDNGEGFTVQNSNIYIDNNMYGLSLNNYRAKLIEGKYYIESMPGMGTTNTLIYQKNKCFT